jgi:hypothetical protein
VRKTVTRSRALARPTRPVATVAALALVAALGLAGCQERPQRTSGGPAPTRATAAAPSSPAEAGSTPVEESSAATPSSPATSQTPSQAPVLTLRDRLLPGEEVPGFNDEFRWVTGKTRTSEGRALFGTCQRFGITSIGATGLAIRDYRPAQPDPANPPAEAGELVAEFPDSTTAQRAFAVLKSWRQQCADRLPGNPHHVGALKSVSVDGGTGGWYLLEYPTSGGDPGAAFFDAQGIAVVGARIVMLELRNVGQDYNYEAGQEPMVAAVQRAAGKLG